MITSKSRLTQADMVLVALFEASGGTRAKVPYEEIVLIAWRKFPHTFALRNHPEHPDSSDIHKRLYQTLVPRDYAVSLGHKIFRLTEKGAARAAKLLGVRSSPELVGRLSREEELFFRHASNTRAFRFWVEGKGDDLVDYDARVFFQFGPTASFEQRNLRLRSALETLDHATRLRLESGQELLKLARALQKKFPGLFAGDRG